MLNHFDMSREALVDLTKRALWTFLQAFLVIWLAFDEPFTKEALVASGAAGLSALKTWVLSTSSSSEV